jgi:phospholipid-translocating ATPase
MDFLCITGVEDKL